MTQCAAGAGQVLVLKYERGADGHETLEAAEEEVPGPGGGVCDGVVCVCVCGGGGVG